MAGVTRLQRIQLGAEVTAGTAVAATAIWRGRGAFQDLVEPQFTEEHVGYLPPVQRSHIPFVQGQLAMDEVEATFEQLPYILMAGVKSVTGVQDGTGTDYIYTFTFPTTAANTIKTYTLEHGDNQQAEEMAFCFVTDFRIAGAFKESMKMQATWVGRQLGTTTFTGAISMPTVEDILFQTGKIYIDDQGGTIGTTQKSNTLISCGLDVMTGLAPYFAADGQLYFSGQESVGPEVSLDLRFKHDGTAVAEIANWRARTARLVRLIFEGSDVATPGTTYSKMTLIIDVAGTWRTFSAIEDQDGNSVVTGSLRCEYNPTAALFAEIVVVNELSALP